MATVSVAAFRRSGLAGLVSWKGSNEARSFRKGLLATASGGNGVSLRRRPFAAVWVVGAQGLRKNSRSHIDASHSRQPLVKGERLVRYEVNAVMLMGAERGAGGWQEAVACMALGAGAGGARSQQAFRDQAPSQQAFWDQGFSASLRCLSAVSLVCYPEGCAAPSFVPCQGNT